MKFYDYTKEPRQAILCLDMKSFYASVECVARGLDPLTTLLVVMSNAESNGGLILASSPAAKEQLGITNVMRKYDLPSHPQLLIVPPRMSLYLQINSAIGEIIRRFVADEDFYCYSVDEFFINLNSSYKLFGQNVYQVALMIKAVIFKETGLHCTIGIGDNPLLAKVALDIEAKHNDDFIATWHYEDVPQTIWQIKELTNMWGIGQRTAKRLQKIGITSLFELAQSDRFRLKNEFGMIGEQLYAHAWGIDRTQLANRYQPLEKSYGNSQVLPKDYLERAELEVVIREMAEQVGARLRKHHCQTACIHLTIGYAQIDRDGNQGFARQMKIPLTKQTTELTNYALILFSKYWQGQAVRNIGLTYTKLVFHTNIQLDLFHSPAEQLMNHKLDTLVDTIRQKYGYTALLHANSLLPGGTAIARSHLVGGHAGGLEGLKG